MAGFQFKQFVIQHDRCAMKVGTDSVMLGSWVKVKDAKTILDIGTGSGLLAIMLAQKSPSGCDILGIDIDQDAIAQANQNKLSSPWSAQLNFHVQSLQESTQRRYDLIVSNPPYFNINHTANREPASGSQKHQARVQARQTLTLSQQDLFDCVNQRLSDNGVFYCVLPVGASEWCQRYAQSIGLFCEAALHVSARPHDKTIRHLLAFSKTQQPTSIKSLCIYDTTGKYSAAYTALCKDYYLHF